MPDEPTRQERITAEYMQVRHDVPDSAFCRAWGIGVAELREMLVAEGLCISNERWLTDRIHELEDQLISHRIVVAQVFGYLHAVDSETASLGFAMSQCALLELLLLDKSDLARAKLMRADFGKPHRERIHGQLLGAIGPEAPDWLKASLDEDDQ